MTQRDMAGYINITPVTLRNWRKNKPELYEIVMKGLAYDEIYELSVKTCERAEEMRGKFSNFYFIYKFNILNFFLKKFRIFFKNRNRTIRKIYFIYKIKFFAIINLYKIKKDFKMYTVEFQAPIENGIVHIPKQYQEIQEKQLLL